VADDARPWEPLGHKITQPLTWQIDSTQAALCRAVFSPVDLPAESFLPREDSELLLRE